MHVVLQAYNPHTHEHTHIHTQENKNYSDHNAFLAQASRAPTICSVSAYGSIVLLSRRPKNCMRQQHRMHRQWRSHMGTRFSPINHLVECKIEEFAGNGIRNGNGIPQKRLFDWTKTYALTTPLNCIRTFEFKRHKTRTRTTLIIAQDKRTFEIAILTWVIFHKHNERNHVRRTKIIPILSCNTAPHRTPHTFIRYLVRTNCNSIRLNSTSSRPNEKSKAMNFTLATPICDLFLIRLWTLMQSDFICRTLGTTSFAFGKAFNNKQASQAGSQRAGTSWLNICNKFNHTHSTWAAQMPFVSIFKTPISDWFIFGMPVLEKETLKITKTDRTKSWSVVQHYFR